MKTFTDTDLLELSEALCQEILSDQADAYTVAAFAQSVTAGEVWTFVEEHFDGHAPGAYCALKEEVKEDRALEARIDQFEHERDFPLP